MVNLLLVMLSISLTAATLYASMSYLPGMSSTTDDAYHQTRYGFVALEKAFNAATSRAEGYAPSPTNEFDGGLATNFSVDYGYLPRAPKGYAWKYGFNGQDYYFCLYPATAAASQAYWRGFNRARKVLSDQQYFILPGGVAACDTTVPQSASLVGAPSAYPAMISMVYLLRWEPPPPPAEVPTVPSEEASSGETAPESTSPGKGKVPIEEPNEPTPQPVNEF